MNEHAVILIAFLAAVQCAPTNETTPPCKLSENMSPKCEKLIKHLLIVLKELVQNHDEGCFLNNTHPSNETDPTLNDAVPSYTTDPVPVADPLDTTDPVHVTDPSGSTNPVHIEDFSDTTDPVQVTDPADTTTSTEQPPTGFNNRRFAANRIVVPSEPAQTPSNIYITTTDVADDTTLGSAEYDTTMEGSTMEDDTTTQEDVEVAQLVTTPVPDGTEEEHVIPPGSGEDHSSTTSPAVTTDKPKCNCGKISCEHLDEYYVPVFRFDSNPSSGGKPIFCQK